MRLQSEMENLAKYFTVTIWPEDNAWYNDIDSDLFEVIDHNDKCPDCGANLNNTLVCPECGYYDNE
jgi:ribosomal protein S27AE